MNSYPVYAALGAPLPTPEEMKEWDASAMTDFLIPETVLMENASREAFHVLAALLEPERRILVLMGGGNNGGDGAALARHLADAGHRVLVCHATPLDALAETSGRHALIARKAGVPFAPLALLSATGLAVPPEHKAAAQTPHVIIDALLGTGFVGPLRERELQIIRFINRMAESVPSITVVSLDVPSGLDALNGTPRPEAVRADHTVTFEAAKTGLAFSHARQFTGKVHIRRIGIPTAVRKLVPASFYALCPKAKAWPKTNAAMHKGDAGRVLVLGGSSGMTGAPVLAALGALRAGAGLVTAACPGQLEPLLHQGFSEIMTLPLGTVAAWGNALLPDCVKAVTDLPAGSAVVVGPGMGRGAGVRNIVAALIEEKYRPPLVLDADALFPLAAGGESGEPVLSPLLGRLREDDCITPHPGEAARILGTSTEDVQAARVQALFAMTGATKATVVLKGAGTLIGRTGGPVFIAPFMTPSLAVGGSGDVLSGIAAAFLSRARASMPMTGLNALHAVCLAVHVHGKAGELLDADHPNRGILAREIADAVPRVSRADCPSGTIFL